MNSEEKSLIALAARVLAFLRDHRQHCYTADELAENKKVMRDDNAGSATVAEICEELSKEGLVEPRREEKGRCYQWVR